MDLMKKIVECIGPIAVHNYPCPVYDDEHAVLNLNCGIMEPSWKAQKEGYILIRVKRIWLKNWILKYFGVGK